jgi:hypothetical protein
VGEASTRRRGIDDLLSLQSGRCGRRVLFNPQQPHRDLFSVVEGEFTAQVLGSSALLRYDIVGQTSKVEAGW